ncbi:MAG: tripartite tricarboxylate transporter TctB family protein [Pelosinus sp.]|nr:tripartite tricarboxylate transporter TctB family protein [Pelosinus sp.]
MAERVLSYIFLLGSLCYAVYAYGLSFGVMSSPKAGFLPTIAGTAAVIIAILIISSGQWTVNIKKERVYWRKSILVTAGLIFYLVGLAVVGYIPATFLVMLYLLKLMEVQDWLIPAIISAAVALFCYGVFNGLLSISLP